MANTARPSGFATDDPASGQPRRRRGQRRAEILAATRALFDESGSRDTQIEDIARAVGVNRAIIYRHFSSKEELFAETVVIYLGELKERLTEADTDAGTRPADERLGRLSDTTIEFGLANPAFVDCALTLVRLPADDLMVEVGDTAVVRLGAAMWECLQLVVEVLDAGIQEGSFHVEDPSLLANLYYAEALGVLSFAALQLSVGQGPAASAVPIEDIKRYARIAAVSQARGR